MQKQIKHLEDMQSMNWLIKNTLYHNYKQVNQALNICLMIFWMEQKVLSIKLLSKGTEIEFSPVYFNSTTKIVINHKFDFEKSFQEMF